MSQLNTPLVEVDKIDVEEGFNPRTHMDPEALERLAGSLDRTAVVQPLTVRAAKGGKFVLISGHRRLEAARMAGIEKVPVHVREGADARTAALVENLHREDLDPIDTARALAALAEQLNLTTHRKIAAELAVSESWVSQHLRLLKLPESIYPYIAAGEVPLEAERPLRRIAAVSPRVAECVCVLAKREKVGGREFLARFDELLIATARARFEDPPTMIDLKAPRLSELVAEEAKRRELAERYRAASPYTHSEDPTLRLGEAEVDAARAAGCLVEHQVDHGDFVSTIAFITDADLAADLAERAVERIEREVAKRRKEEEKQKASREGVRAFGPEAKQALREAERREREETAGRARRFNEELGIALLKRRGGASRKEHSLARFKAIAAILLADNPKLAARGLRLVADQLREVEVKPPKANGEAREKVSYADPVQCADYLAERIRGVRSVGEGLELLGDAVIASLLADEEELPQSRRIGSAVRASAEVAELLGADIKSVRPRRPRKADR